MVPANIPREGRDQQEQARVDACFTVNNGLVPGMSVVSELPDTLLSLLACVLWQVMEYAMAITLWHYEDRGLYYQGIA